MGPTSACELFRTTGHLPAGRRSRQPGRGDAEVAERVIHHYDTRPEPEPGRRGLLRGAGRRASRTPSAEARQRRPDLDRFFADDRLDGFFVKNLETVQGDERDVDHLVDRLRAGRGRQDHHELRPAQPAGRVAPAQRRHHPRPLPHRGRQQHPRRSTSPSPSPAKGRGTCAATSTMPPAGLPATATGARAGGDAGQPFEESVINVMRSWGYALTPQVGAAGYRIDIGIHHPSQPGVFALGIECDGYQYHSAKAARDRDRLREKVLRDLGWNLHRIWGTSWYRDRKGEERRLQAAIEHAMAAPVHGLPGGASTPADTGAARRPDRGGLRRGGTPLGHAVRDGGRAGPAALGRPGRPGQPVHHDGRDPRGRRLRSPRPHRRPGISGSAAWHIGPIGTRIRDNMDAAVGLADVIQDGEFLTLADAPRPAVRTPVPACERTVDQVHDDELALALISFIRDAGGISRSELTARIARLYGWAGHEPDITGRMGAAHLPAPPQRHPGRGRAGRHGGARRGSGSREGRTGRRTGAAVAAAATGCMLAPMTEPGPDTQLSRAAASEAVRDIGWRYLLGTLALCRCRCRHWRRPVRSHPPRSPPSGPMPTAICAWTCAPTGRSCPCRRGRWAR